MQKNYRIIRFLNREHSAATKSLLAAAAWGAVATATLDLRLARRIGATVWRGDFKSSLRQTQWFMRRGWYRLGVISDPFLDFTENLDEAELEALLDFLDRRENEAEAFELATDRLYALGRLAHLALETGNAGLFARRLDAYGRQADRALSLLPLREANPAQAGGRKGNGRRADFSSADADGALQDFARIARDISLDWYAISGTLLGIVREGGWLPHDYDIDLGVDAAGLDFEALQKAFSTLPCFTVKRVDHQLRIARDGGDGNRRVEWLPVMLKLIHRTGINVDVFVHHLEDGVCWHGSMIHRWDNTPFEIAEYRLGPVAVPGPADADLYLTENYGAWRVPVTEFSSTTGTPNLGVVRNLFSPALFIKRIGMGLRAGDLAGADQMMARLRAAGAVVDDAGVPRFNPDFV